MPWEEVGAGGGIALLSTWFASWLLRRETLRLKREREARLRGLLAAEIAGNLMAVIPMRLLDIEEKKGIDEREPTYLQLRKTAFGALLADLNAFPADVTKPVLDCYEIFGNLTKGGSTNGILRERGEYREAHASGRAAPREGERVRCAGGLGSAGGDHETRGVQGPGRQGLTGRGRGLAQQRAGIMGKGDTGLDAYPTFNSAGFRPNSIYWFESHRVGHVRRGVGRERRAVLLHFRAGVVDLVDVDAFFVDPHVAQTAGELVRPAGVAVGARNIAFVQSTPRPCCAPPSLHPMGKPW